MRISILMLPFAFAVAFGANAQEFVLPEKEPGQNWVQPPTHEGHGPRGSLRPGWLDAELSAGRDGTAHFDQASKGDRQLTSQELLRLDFGGPSFREWVADQNRAVAHENDSNFGSSSTGVSSGTAGQK